MNPSGKKNILWSNLLRIVMIFSIILAIWRNDILWVVGTSIGLFVSILPTILKKDTSFTLPFALDFLLAFVSLLHMGGRLFDYYYNIEGYMLITRFFISILIAFIGFSMVYILHVYWDGLRMDKYAMGFVTVIFTMAIGVFFEFVKYLNLTGGASYYVNTNQVLMLNLSADTAAGIIIAIIGVSLMKRGKFDEVTGDLGPKFDEVMKKRKSKKKKL